MKFLPVEKYTLISSLKPETVLEKLSAEVNTIGGGSVSSNMKYHKSYRGKISGSDFEISRIIGYRNSFLPVIKGMVSGFSGSEIKIHMRINKAVIIFCSVWMIAMAASFAGGIIARINSGSNDLPLFIPLLMLVLAYALILGGFKYESIKSGKFLKELFQAEEV